MKKSILAFVMALVLAFGCIGGVSAENVNTEAKKTGPVTFDAEFGMDTEQIAAFTGSAMTEDNKKALKLMGDLFSVLKLHAVVDPEQKAGEIMLKADDDILVSGGLKADAKGITLASSLTGDQVVLISVALIKEFAKQLSSAQAKGGFNIQELISAVKGLDREKVGKDLTAVFQEFAGKIQAKIGEPETGEFSVDGMTFTARMPVNITYEEMVDALAGVLKGVLKAESLQPVVQLFAKGEDLGAKLDAKLEEGKKKLAEDRITTSLYVYSDEKGNTYAAIDMSQESGMKIHYGAGAVDGKTLVNLNMAGKDGEKADFHMTADDNAADAQGEFEAQGAKATMTVHGQKGQSESVVEVTQGEMSVKTVTTVKVADGKGTYDSAWYLNGNEKAMFFLKLSAAKGGELTLKYEGDGLTVIPVEKLLGRDNQSVMGSLALSVAGNLAEALSKLIRHLPEDSAQLLGSLVTNAIMRR